MTDKPEIPKGQPGLAEAALFGCCPRCGNRTLFAGVAKFAPRCRQCGLDFSAFNVGDGPAAFLTLGVGTQTLTLTASDPAPGGGASSFAWTPAPGLTAINGATAVFAPSAAGTYTYRVRATNAQGCSADATVTVVAIDKRRGR